MSQTELYAQWHVYHWLQMSYYMTSVFFTDLMALIFCIKLCVSLEWLLHFPVISHFHLIDVNMWQSSLKAHLGRNEVRNQVIGRNLGKNAYLRTLSTMY